MVEDKSKGERAVERKLKGKGNESRILDAFML